MQSHRAGRVVSRTRMVHAKASYLVEWDYERDDIPPTIIRNL